MERFQSKKNSVYSFSLNYVRLNLSFEPMVSFFCRRCTCDECSNMTCLLGNCEVEHLSSVNICEQVINELCNINNQALIKIHEKIRFKKTANNIFSLGRAFHWMKDVFMQGRQTESDLLLHHWCRLGLLVGKLSYFTKILVTWMFLFQLACLLTLAECMFLVSLYFSSQSRLRE